MKTKTLDSAISHLPPEQRHWMLTIKEIFKPTILYGSMEINDLIKAFKIKAGEKNYANIINLLDEYNFEEYFKR